MNWLCFLQHPVFPGPSRAQSLMSHPQAVLRAHPSLSLCIQSCPCSVCPTSRVCLSPSSLRGWHVAGARRAPSTDSSLLWSACFLTAHPAADSCFRDVNGIPFPPRCQRFRGLLTPNTTRSSLGLMQRLPSELSLCCPQPVLHAGHCCPLTTHHSHPKAHGCLPLWMLFILFARGHPVSQTSACHLLNGSGPRVSGRCHHSLLQVLCAAFIPGWALFFCWLAVECELWERRALAR